MGLFSRLFLRGRAQAVAELPQAPEPPEVKPPATAQRAAPEPRQRAAPEPGQRAAPEPQAPAADDGSISPARLDQALKRLRDEIPARENGPPA